MAYWKSIQKTDVLQSGPSIKLQAQDNEENEEADGLKQQFMDAGQYWENGLSKVNLGLLYVSLVCSSVCARLYL